MGWQAKFVRVAEGLYQFEKNETASNPYYAYFWHGGKQIKQRLKGIDREQAKREMEALRDEDSPGLQRPWTDRTAADPNPVVHF